MNFYMHHIGDYAAATAHLTFVEDAAYSRLIRIYYRDEKPLPADVKAVQRLTGARTEEEKDAVATVLEEFFALQDDGWHNRRCDEEIANAQESQAEAEERRKHEKERKRRYRQRRSEIFEQLREHGIVPAFDTSLSDLEAQLSRVLSRGTGKGQKNMSQGTERGHVADGDGDGTANQTPDSRLQTNNKTPSAGSKAASATRFKYSDEQIEIAQAMTEPVINRFPAQKINLDEWADAVRKLMEIDGYSRQEIGQLWRQIVTDERPGFCWADNCRTPMKLRDKKDGLSYFEIIRNQLNRGQSNGHASTDKESQRRELIEATRGESRHNW